MVNEKNMYENNAAPGFELRPVTKKDFTEVFETSLQRDFGHGGLRPLAPTLALYDKGVYSGFTAFEKGRKVGYAFFAGPPGESCLLLDYFAVEPDLQGHGYGSRMLAQAQSFTGTCLLIEAEHPAAAKTEAERKESLARLRFYRRAGAKNLHVHWLAYGMDYTVLHLPVKGRKAFTTGQGKAAMKNIYKHLTPSNTPYSPRFL